MTIDASSLGGLPLAVIPIAAYLLYLVVQSVLDPLRGIPGPFITRFTRWWYFLEVYRGSFEKTNIELHQKYGPIVRLAPGEYSVRSSCKPSISEQSRKKMIILLVWQSLLLTAIVQIDDVDAVKTIYGHGTAFVKV